MWKNDYHILEVLAFRMKYLGRIGYGLLGTYHILFDPTIYGQWHLKGNISEMRGQLPL